MRYSYFVTAQHCGKSEFHLVGYIYSITRAQQAKLKCSSSAYAPGRYQPGSADRGVRSFFAKRNIQKFCELC